ncbi:hypothetical protein [Gulosibacter molinativorax]|uniref:hypothetical protein n=1 Tax=Gulosibacter molinativorax TaxID=256821 RepID=UPI0003FB8452|nr:hypothetical protein [Gulosibacter molinativorax]QUY60843.1 Hypotetical protein [Gulosibacter molinativorax]
MTKKTLAWIFTGLTILVAIISNLTGNPPFLDPVMGILGLAAIILWCMIWIPARQKRRQVMLDEYGYTKKPNVVQVTYVESVTDQSTGGMGYSYTWGLSELPKVGDFVLAPVEGEEPKLAMIVGFDKAPEGIELKSVLRKITDEEMIAAAAERAAEEEAWLDHARLAVGLPVGDVGPFPEGYPVVPPATGDADPTAADAYGRGWWRIYKHAEENELPASEIEAFKTAANRWFAIRDRA